MAAPTAASTAVLRRISAPRTPLRSLLRLEAPRLFSSAIIEPEEDELPSPAAAEDDLRGRIFRLRFPKRSAMAALERWVGEGRTVSAPELREIAKDLKKSHRYKHALEILTWMESQHSFRVSALDHAARLDLITKVHTLSEAEAYFERLPNSASKKAASFSLLHCYVKERDLKKAEAFMEMLLSSGLAVDPHLFNEMMKLYMATSHFQMVFDVIKYMKRGNIPLNVLSYNLWLNACGEVSGLASVEVIRNEVSNDKNIEEGWSLYCTLASIYAKHGLNDLASGALKTAEEKLSVRKRLGYSFIMTQYAALNDRCGVLRLWESSRRVAERITCADYMSAILCLVKVGDIEEAERLFREWESGCRKYDIRVSNVLLGAYMRNGCMDKAEKLHVHTLQKGAAPNYKTWEILMEGWVKTGQMDKAVIAMKRGFALLKYCIWKPPSEVLIPIAKYLEEQGSVDDMKSYVNGLRRVGLMSLPLYKSYLRAHIHAGRKSQDVPRMMESDGIKFDEEIWELIRCAAMARNH